MRKWTLKRDGYVALDFTNHCNLNCIMCVTSKIPSKERQHMDFGLFKKIIDNLSNSKYLPETLNPFWFGEPLLNPNFIEMMGYARKLLPEVRFEMHTNATFLTKEVTGALLVKSPMKRIICSLDAATKETYNNIRKGGDFDRVDRNIRFFLKTRKTAPPYLVFQFIMMDENRKEMDQFVEYWRFILKRKIPVVFDEAQYPEDDCIFIRKLDTSSQYLADAQSLFESGKVEKEKVTSEKFSLFLPYSLANIDSKIYDKVAEIPESLLPNLNDFFDSNQPNFKLDKKKLAEAIDEKTRIFVGMASNEGYDNSFSIFSDIKKIDPFIKTVLFWVGNKAQAPQHLSIDKIIVSWKEVQEMVSKSTSTENFTPKEAFVIMPRIFEKCKLSILQDNIRQYKQLQDYLNGQISIKSIDLNLNNKIPRVSDKVIVFILNMHSKSNAVKLGANFHNPFYVDKNFMKVFKLFKPLRNLSLSDTKEEILYIRPESFNLKSFPGNEFEVEASFLQTFKKSFYISRIDLNIEELPSLKSFKAVVIENHKSENNSILTTEKIKSIDPDIPVYVIEHDKRKVRETSYKDSVDCVLFNIEWTFLPALAISSLDMFRHARSLNSLLKSRFDFDQFMVKDHRATIISGQHQHNSKTNYYDIMPKLGTRHGPVYVIPKVYETPIPREIVPPGGMHVIDTNISPIPTKSGNYLIPNLLMTNNSLELAKLLKGTVVIVEKNAARIKETAAHEGVDFVSLTSEVSFGSYESFLEPGVAFKYGSNVIQNPGKARTYGAFYQPKNVGGKTILISPVLHGISKFPKEELDIEGWIYDLIPGEKQYLNANFDDVSNLKADNIIIVRHKQKNNAFEIAKQLKNVTIVELNPKEAKSTALKPGVKLVATNPSIESFTFHDYWFNVKGAAFKYGPNVVVSPASPLLLKIESGPVHDHVNEKLPKRKPGLTVLISPLLHGISRFPKEELDIEEWIYDLIPGEKQYLNANLEDISKVKADNIIIVRHKQKNNAFEIAKQLKNVTIVELNPKEAKSTALKPGVKLVATNPSIESFTFHDYWFGVKGVAFKYGSNVVLNPTNAPILKIESGPVHNRVKQKLPRMKTGLTVLISPVLHGISRFPKEELNIEEWIYDLIPGEKQYLNANFDDVSKLKADNIIIVRHKQKNNAFEIAKQLKNVTIVELNSKEAKATALKPGVNFVITYFSKEIFLNPFARGGALKYGPNILFSESKKSPRELKQGPVHNHVNEKFHLAGPINLIIPKFFKQHPIEIYEIARKIHKDSFLDANFEEVKFGKINLGVFTENYPNNLMTIFKKKKSGKNIVIYIGSNPKSVFVNPYVDAVIPLDFKLINQLLEKGLIQEGVLLKFGTQPIKGSFKKSNLSNIEVSWNQTYLESLSVMNSVVQIDQFDFLKSNWDDYGPKDWHGDEDYHDGFSSVFGVNHGYFEYKFDSPVNLTKDVEIQIRICSHSHNEEELDKYSSEVFCSINNIKQKKQLFYEPNRNNFLEKWYFKKVKLKTRGNILRLEVPRDAKFKNGITIYGNAITQRYKKFELPIIIAIKK